MSERPFPVIRNLFKNDTANRRELNRYVFEKIDGISLWVIGLSFAVIVALVSKFPELNKLLTAGQVKFIFCLLFISVTCGIFYRIIYILYYIYVDSAFRAIEVSLSDLGMVDIESGLNGKESFEDLIREIKQFQDLEYLIDVFNKGTDEHRIELYNDMVELYRTETRIAKDELDLSFETVEDAYKTNLGVNLNLRNPNPEASAKAVERIKFLRTVSVSLYIIFVVTFLAALGYFLYVI